MNSYEKLKYLVKKLIKGEVISKNLQEFETNNISIDTYSKFITKLNDIKILESISKGENVIKDQYFNSTYFFDNDKNAALIASIAHLESKKSKFFILEYIFKHVPNNLLFMITNLYTTQFDKNIIQLMDETKYKYFATIIEENKAISKLICQVFDCNTNQYFEMIPLELFIHNESWYICYYDMNNKKLNIIDALYISEAKINENSFQKYIAQSEIDKVIKSFITGDLNKIESLTIRLKPETLNLLVKFDLIDMYEVYKESIDLNKTKNLIGDIHCFSNQADSLEGKKKLLKVRFYHTKDKYNAMNYDKVIFQQINCIRYFFVKITTSKNKLDYLLKQFKGIEIIDIDKYYFCEE